MHLTVLLYKGEELYSKGDFDPEFREHQISLILAEEELTFNGKNTQKIPTTTTHLLMHFLDRLSEKDLKRLPNLRYIGTCSTGWWDHYFDLDYIRRKKIALDINATYAQNAVAEGVFASLLSHARYIPEILHKQWDADVTHGFELQGKSLGIIGMGRIGSRVRDIANAFGMEVLYAGSKEAKGIKKVTLNKLLSLSDIITIHVPKSIGILFTKDSFNKLKSNTIILNSSGFELIDSDALQNYLTVNTKAQYIHLAMPNEEIYDKLNHLPNVNLYPLFTCYTQEADRNRKIIPLKNLRAFLQNQITPNRVI